ncbi:MAG TPA: hypothetical protein VKV95_00065 [Terriglobia bacterium]|nr:hypothetical protein [Terriglobia bacterium]
MRTLLRWAARLYPSVWRNRYGLEFDSLLEDISPTIGDLWDVLTGVVRERATVSMRAEWVLATDTPAAFRLPVVASLVTHGLVIVLVLLILRVPMSTMPLRIVAPLPPPVPEAPPEVTDARVFPNGLTLYSSLPLAKLPEGHVLPLYVTNGVGINFFSLPDIGASYRQGNREWRVWPGQALESFIVRRVLPEYPLGTSTRGAVSVFIEYLITLDGSVKVLRTSGPDPFAVAAQSAVQGWIYQPLAYENRPCEVVSRVEIRFDSEFAHSVASD